MKGDKDESKRREKKAVLADSVAAPGSCTLRASVLFINGLSI